MYKFLLVTLLLSVGTPVLAQDPDPNLFRTWHLYYLEDDAAMYNIATISPSIDPYLTISENLNYNGEGACNSFNGTYSVPYPGGLETVAFNYTTEDCGNQTHNSFETYYFSLMATGGDYQITQDGNGYVLYLSTPLMNYAEFRSYSLSTPDSEKEGIAVYPNPTHSKLFINSSIEPITSLELFTIWGERIQHQQDQFDSMNMAYLASGMYLLRIATEEGTVVKKIIKQ